MKFYMYVVVFGNDFSMLEFCLLVVKLEDMFCVLFNFMECIVLSIVDYICKGI